MSNIPEAPQDLETKKIIDTFAQYVAKNGPGFEEITRQKQFGNPKFAFLFGREYADYYRFQLMCEIQMLSNPGRSNPSNGEIMDQLMAESMCYEGKVQALRQQISDSDKNLKAQNQVLQLQKQSRVDNLLTEKKNTHIYSLIEQVGLTISSFESLIDHMSTSGSKDTISNTKKWIFDNCQTDQLREVILTYLLHRVRLNTATDTLRLHILYLINDWAHYCQRKKLDNVRQMLSRYVPKLYAYASSSPTLERSFSEKLDKLIGVWEGYKYFDDNCYKQLRNPASIMANEQAQAYAEQQKIVEQVEKELDETFKSYQKQHQDFEKHILLQINNIEEQHRREQENMQREIEIQKLAQMQEAALIHQRSNFERENNRYDYRDKDLPRSYNTINNGFEQPPDESLNKIPSLFSTNISTPQAHLSLPKGMPPPLMGKVLFSPVKLKLTDDLIPKCPYYELPAGMMVPLVSLDQCTHEILDSTKLRIPPPEPPSEFLLSQLDRFYAMHATPDNPRDADGWEQKGLAEFYQKKQECRTKIEEKMKKENKIFDDAITNRFVSPTDNELVQANPKTLNLSRSRRSSSFSSSSSSSSSRSRSSSKSRSRSQSKSRENSVSPRHRKIDRRSISPDDVRPSFGGHSSSSASTSFVSSLTTQRLHSFKIPNLPPPINRSENKGAQLMTKMGWEGRGLGANAQGIEEPIHPGDIRDRDDQYRGVGSKADIFEEYRRQMSARKSGSRRRND